MAMTCVNGCSECTGCMACQEDGFSYGFYENDDYAWDNTWDDEY